MYIYIYICIYICICRVNPTRVNHASSTLKGEPAAARAAAARCRSIRTT